MSYSELFRTVPRDSLAEIRLFQKTACGIILICVGLNMYLRMREPGAAFCAGSCLQRDRHTKNGAQKLQE